MSHVKVKTTWEEMASYGGTTIRTLYCHHNQSADTVTYYDEKGGVECMDFESWSTGKDKWDAMQRLWYPFKDEWLGELKDGVEYWFTEPWKNSM
jgi:hypothetical protein